MRFVSARPGWGLVLLQVLAAGALFCLEGATGPWGARCVPLTPGVQEVTCAASPVASFATNHTAVSLSWAPTSPSQVA